MARKILAAADVVKDRKVSAYPAVGPGVTVGGGEYADILVDKVVADGNSVKDF